MLIPIYQSQNVNPKGFGVHLSVFSNFMLLLCSYILLFFFLFFTFQDVYPMYFAGNCLRSTWQTLDSDVRLTLIFN